MVMSVNILNTRSLEVVEPGDVFLLKKLLSYI